ncbi:hypothetical protein JJD41_12625 [Oxynema sp. CENA135]|uniref:lipase family protein n=1 Tax=Oxynema sp. CENA135 TaxID=984206 RepID=UPI001909B51E|nr:hypothetical protein [Oxynema sp. CENA135]MBK4730703.1 hypothetical protein [Oxynema sp. CENA135]
MRKATLTVACAIAPILCSFDRAIAEPSAPTPSTYPLLQEYKNFCARDPVGCRDVAIASEIAADIIYTSELQGDLSRCPWTFPHCQPQDYRIIDLSLSNDEIIDRLNARDRPQQAGASMVKTFIEQLRASFQDLGGYALIFHRQNRQENGRERHHYLIAFKGTNPLKINDLFSDLSFPAVPLSAAQPDLLVHSGFYRYAASIFEATLPDIETFLALQNDPNVDLEIMVTGHSLGAAAASIYTALLKNYGIRASHLKLITLAAPPFLKEEAVAAFDRAYGDIPTIDVENRGDIILDSPIFDSLIYRLSEYSYPNFGEKIEGLLSETLEKLYKQRELEKATNTVPAGASDPQFALSGLAAIDAKIKIEQVQVHTISYTDYYQYYLEVLQGDRRFQNRLAAPRNRDDSPNRGSSFALNYTLDPNLGAIAANALALSPDGKTLALASASGSLQIWKTEDGTIAHTFDTTRSGPQVLTYMPNGRQLFVGGEDGGIAVYDLASFSQVSTIPGTGDRVTALAVDRQGDRLLVGRASGKIDSFKLENSPHFEKDNFVKIRTFDGEGDRITALATTPDGRTLLSSDWQGRIKRWDLASGEALSLPRGRLGKVWHLFDDDRGRSMVASSFDNKIELWNLETGEIETTLRDRDGTIWAIAVSPDGQTLVSSSWDGQVKIWDLATGGLVKTLGNELDVVTSLAFGPDGKTLVTALWNGRVKLWQRGRVE